MTDSLFVISSSGDTIHVLLSNQTPGIPNAVVVSLSTLLGIVITIIGNWLNNKRMASQQAINQIKIDFFNRKLSVHLAFSEMLWKGHAVVFTAGKDNNMISFPECYMNFDDFQNWVNSMSHFVRKNRILLEDDIFNNYQVLAAKLINDIQFMERNRFSENDVRKYGSENLHKTQKLTEKVLDATKKYVFESFDFYKIPH